MSSVKAKVVLIACFCAASLLINCDSNSDEDTNSGDVIDVSGSWTATFTEDGSNDTFSVSLTISQTETTIDGTFSGGESQGDIEGTISGTNINLQFLPSGNDVCNSDADLELNEDGNLMTGSFQEESGGTCGGSFGTLEIQKN